MSSSVAGNLVTVQHMIPDWITRILEDCENEAESYQAWNIKLVGGEARKIVWNICSLVGAGTRGVPGLACRLLEQYLAATFQRRGRIMVGDAIEDEIEDNEDQGYFVEQLSAELPLLIAACAQLAAKMTSVSAITDLKNVRTALMQRNINYTLQEIINAEYKVLGMLEYRIPLWTSLETAELLAVDSDVPLRWLNVVGAMVHLAEFYRHEVEKKVLWAANGSQESNSGECGVRTLHVCAGAVAAALRVLGRGPAPPPRLAARTRAPAAYIRCIADAVLYCVFSNDHDADA